jgi:transposase
LVVGIDIAQQLHVARAVSFRGIVIGNPLSFSNDEQGFQQLLQWIQRLQTDHKLTAAIEGRIPVTSGHIRILETTELTLMISPPLALA